MRQMTNRKPVAAGVLYPKTATELKTKISSLLAENPATAVRDPKTIVVPQGSYDQVGSLYAKAYNCIRGKKYDVVVILAYSNSEFFNYFSIFSGEEYSSPLGSVKVDVLLRDELADEDDDIYVSEKGHASEDTFIELQIPWLQTVLEPGFKIIPLVMGNQSIELCQELDKALSEVLTQRNILVVACSDLVFEGKTTPKSVEKYNDEFLDELQTKTMEKFFVRKWRDNFKAGSFGSFYVGKQVAKNLGMKEMTVFEKKSVKEIRSGSESTVCYYAMAFSR